MMPVTAPRLERKDDTIPLTGDKMGSDEIERYVNPLIQERLRTLFREGWEADGATDILTLWRQGRLASREHTSFWLDKHTYDLKSVTLRVRRISTA